MNTEALDSAQLAGLVAALLAADTGPMVRLDLARQWAIRARAEGNAAGQSTGYLAAVADEKAAQLGLARLAPGMNPWHLCCGPCRHRGHRTGCTRCEDRTPATFGQTHIDDFPGAGEKAVAA